LFSRTRGLHFKVELCQLSRTLSTFLRSTFLRSTFFEKMKISSKTVAIALLTILLAALFVDCAPGRKKNKSKNRQRGRGRNRNRQQDGSESSDLSRSGSPVRTRSKDTRSKDTRFAGTENLPNRFNMHQEPRVQGSYPPVSRRPEDQDQKPLESVLPFMNPRLRPRPMPVSGPRNNHDLYRMQPSLAQPDSQLNDILRLFPNMDAFDITRYGGKQVTKEAVNLRQVNGRRVRFFKNHAVPHSRRAFETLEEISQDQAKRIARDRRQNPVYMQLHHGIFILLHPESAPYRNRFRTPTRRPRPPNATLRPEPEPPVVIEPLAGPSPFSPRGRELERERQEQQRRQEEQRRQEQQRPEEPEEDEDYEYYEV